MTRNSKNILFKNTQQISYPSSLTLKDEETNNALHPHDNNRGFSRKIGVVEQNIIEALKMILKMKIKVLFLRKVKPTWVSWTVGMFLGDD